MADNYVVIKIKADDTAKPDLTGLKLDLDELGRKVETARVNVDDEEAKLKLLDMNAKLAALNRRVANPKISTASAARAESDIAKVNAEMGKLVKKADSQAQTKGGALGRFLFGRDGNASGLSGEVSKIKDDFSKIKDASSKLPGMGANTGLGGLPFIGGIASNPYGLAALTTGLVAVLPELTGLVSGFAAAGAGAGAFYLLAHPAISNLTGDMKKLSSANQAIGYAQQTENIDPTKAHLKALQTAQLKYKAIYQQMGQDAGPAAAGMTKLHDTYVKMSNAFQPQVFKVLNDGLKIANNLLPVVTPLATAFANALDGLLKHVGKFTQSKGFKDWLKQFEGLVGPSMTAIGNGIGKVAVAFGKLMMIMSKKDVVNAINIAFSVLSGTISAIGAVVKFAMRMWDGLTTAVVWGRNAIRASLSWFGGLGGLFSRWWGQATSAASGQINRLIGYARGIPGRILGAVGNLGGLLFGAGQRVIQGLINGIGSMIGSVGSAIGNIASEITSHLPFSPAKKGPLSGQGSPDKAGRRIGQMLAQGISGSTSVVSAAAAHMAGGAVTGASGRAGGGGQVVIHIAPGAGGSGLDALFWTWLKAGVRVQGGDPAMFQRKVAYS